jgi:hypothetical protein
MSDDPAVDSFKYALNPTLVKLYLTILIGYLLIGGVTFFSKFIVDVEPYQSIIEAPFLIIGGAMIIGGLVGTLHRILSDTV